MSWDMDNEGPEPGSIHRCICKTVTEIKYKDFSNEFGNLKYVVYTLIAVSSVGLAINIYSLIRRKDKK